jgi:peptidoglycan hydrolase CwlO-like protein
MTENNVFIKIENYNEILDVLDLFKKKLHDTQNTLDEIVKIRIEEEEEINSWKANLEQVQNEINKVSKNLFEMNN